MDLKICGMRDSANILEVAKAKPQYMGFIFYQGSPRFVGDNFVMPELDPEIKKVGVFVNAPTGAILEITARYALNLVQLHGDESVEQCEELKNHNVLVIKAFPMDEKVEFQDINGYHAAVDFFLFDTKGKYFGGNAKRFDWRVLARYNQQTPFFLSGGLAPENIAEAKALRDMNIVALDVNSGVEIRAGVKDIDKVKQVVSLIRD
ncbi:MAG TPA: phosphoribosylanthranilate isomerase [Chryseosolibacter sp.]